VITKLIYQPAKKFGVSRYFHYLSSHYKSSSTDSSTVRCLPWGFAEEARVMLKVELGDYDSIVSGMQKAVPARNFRHLRRSVCAHMTRLDSLPRSPYRRHAVCLCSSGSKGP